MLDTGPRRRRLLSLLPRIFAEQPDSSAIGALIETMAASLAELDENLTRLQRDHWVKFARADETGNALERLGLMLGIPRLYWKEAAPTKNEASQNITQFEEIEAYRQRLQLTARVLMRGLTTPRALLELAIATLGAEPCPRQQRDKDATLGIGLPLGTVRRCPVCQSNAEGPCPNADRKVLKASITDNPPENRTLKKPALAVRTPFEVLSNSLTEDVPLIGLKALDQAVQYPYVQNLATGETVFYAGTLAPGEELCLWPKIETWETECYDSHDPVDAHAWIKDYPSGRAILINANGKTTSPVDAQVCYLSISPGNAPVSRFSTESAVSELKPPKFAEPNEADEGTCFAFVAKQVRNPRVRPGQDLWVYGTYNQADIEGIGIYAGDTLYEGFHAHAPIDANQAPVDLTLSWWVRPTAAFRLRIPRNAWVAQAEKRDILTVLERWIQQAKAAGVMAWLDYSEPQAAPQQTMATRASPSKRSAKSKKPTP